MTDQSFRNTQSSRYIVMLFIFTFLILIETNTYSEFRIRHNISRQRGIIGWILHRSIWQRYLVRRILLLIEHLVHTYYLFIPLYISLLIMSKLNWSEKDYFYSLLFLPLYSNAWVYIKFNFKSVKFNSYEVIFMRRSIIYIFIIVYSILDSYGKFTQVLSNSSKNLSFEYVFVYSAVVIYIAIDRLLKELVSDIDKYTKEKKEKEREKEKKHKENIKIRSLRRRRI